MDPCTPFSEALATALRSGDQRGVYVLGANAASISALLRIDGVAGVILPTQDHVIAEQFPGHVGWFDWSRMAFKLPEQPAELAIGLFAQPEVGLRVGRALWQGGVRRVGRFDAERCAIVDRRLSFLIAHRIAAMSGSGFQRVLRQIPRRIGPPDRVQVRQATDPESTWKRAFDNLKPFFADPVLPKREFDPNRVLIVTGSLGAGGSERQVVYTALGLQEHVRQLSVVCQNSGPGGDFFLDRVRTAGIEVVSLDRAAILDAPVCLAPVGRRLQEVINWDDLLVSQIMDFAAHFVVARPGVVHAWLDWTNVAAGIAALLVGVPRVVLSGRSLSPEHFAFCQPFMRPGYKAMLFSERVILLNNSVAGAQDYARWLGIDQQLIRVVPNAIDQSELRRPSLLEIAAYRSSLGVPENATVLGGLFRLSAEKRPKLWLDIAAAVARLRPDVRFLMVGDGPEREATARYAAELGLTGKLCLPGQTVDAGLALAAMDCFLLTSRVEGLPNVLLEAQLAGVPVVTSDVGGAKETLDASGLAGVAVHGDDPDAYADAILQLLRDKEDREVRRDALPRLVVERFGLDRMVRDTLRVYSINQ